MKKINIKSVITGFVFACCLPASVHALADGWTMVPREPALDLDIDVNTYTFKMNTETPKYLTLKIAEGRYDERTVQREFEKMAKANNCSLKGSPEFKPETAKAECGNEERAADYTFYIRGNHGQLLLIGSFNVTYDEIEKFMQGLENEKANQQ